jgi:predicted nucleotidyltransferase
MVVAAGIELAEGYARTLAERLGDELVRVSLFGSRARGDHRPSSDFDLMIVLRQAGGEARSAVHLLAVEVELEHQVDLSTKVLRLADFDRLASSSLPFWRRFRRDERILWPTAASTSG